jgi:hypothetical protein
VGIGIGVPLTYIFTVIFSVYPNALALGSLMFTGVAWGVIFVLRKRNLLRLSSFSVIDIVAFVFSLLISTWIMTKTFHGDPSGRLFVGSNNVFDFGFAVGLMRSISWGANIPFMSPFFAGLPLVYHFMFIFWSALLEYFGVSATWAINIPSIYAFAILLLLSYYVPQRVLKQKPVVGLVTMCLVLSNSSLTFWHLLTRSGFSLSALRDLWNMQTYPFAGPFDGSVISIFMTLNSFVNQRHLAFSVAMGLAIFLIANECCVSKKVHDAKLVLLGILMGSMFLWNMAVFIIVFPLVTVLIAVHKQWRAVILFGIVTVLTVLFSVLPMWTHIYKAILFLRFMYESGASATQVPGASWNIWLYLWENLSVLPLLALYGYIQLKKEARLSTIPFVFFFILLCVYASISKSGFNQKFLNVLIIGINMLAAVGVWHLWQKKIWFTKILGIVLFAWMTLSGVIDVIPIKNEFAYPLISEASLPLIRWIKQNTPKDAVFVSYSDIVDPVVLAGRKNYFGFFGNIGQYEHDYATDVRSIYMGDVARASSKNISYILVPKGEKNDFPYQVKLPVLQSSYSVAFENENVMIFDARQLK